MGLKCKLWIIKAKRDGTCKETGKQIKEGDRIMYLPGVRNLSTATVYSEESNFFKENENRWFTSHKYRKQIDN